MGAIGLTDRLSWPYCHGAGASAPKPQGGRTCLHFVCATWVWCFMLEWHTNSYGIASCCHARHCHGWFGVFAGLICDHGSIAGVASRKASRSAGIWEGQPNYIWSWVCGNDMFSRRFLPPNLAPNLPQIFEVDGGLHCWTDGLGLGPCVIQQCLESCGTSQGTAKCFVQIAREKLAIQLLGDSSPVFFRSKKIL